MGAHSFEDLLRHVGHDIVVVTYGGLDSDFTDDAGKGRITQIENVAVECETCCEVLLDYDKPIYNLTP